MTTPVTTTVTSPVIIPVTTLSQSAKIADAYSQIMQALGSNDVEKLAKKKLLTFKGKYNLPVFFEAVETENHVYSDWSWLQDPQFLNLAKEFLPFNLDQERNIEKVMEKFPEVIALLEGKHAEIYKRIFLHHTPCRYFVDLGNMVSSLDIPQIRQYANGVISYPVLLLNILNKLLEETEDTIRLRTKIEKFNTLVKGKPERMRKSVENYTLPERLLTGLRTNVELFFHWIKDVERDTIEAWLDSVLAKEQKDIVDCYNKLEEVCRYSPRSIVFEKILPEVIDTQDAIYQYLSDQDKREDFRKKLSTLWNEVMISKKTVTKPEFSYSKAKHFLHKVTTDPPQETSIEREYKEICGIFGKEVEKAYPVLLARPKFHCIIAARHTFLSEKHWKDLEARFEKNNMSNDWFCVLEMRQDSIAFLIILDKTLVKLRMKSNINSFYSLMYSATESPTESPTGPSSVKILPDVEQPLEPVKNPLVSLEEKYEESPPVGFLAKLAETPPQISYPSDIPDLLKDHSDISSVSSSENFEIVDKAEE